MATELIRVILESPYGNSDPSIIKRNINYARECVRDSLRRLEAPIASHLLYTQENILNDNNINERRWGIEAGLAWISVAQKTVVYTDHGISVGMKIGIDRAIEYNIPVEYRKLYD